MRSRSPARASIRPATVDITSTWSGSNATAGGNTGPQTTTSQATSDASGGFTFTIDAGPGHGGTYDIAATAGGCTATAQVTALETAGGINTGGTGGTGGTTGVANPTPPATDAAPLADRGHGPVPLPVLPVAGGLALLAIAGLLLVRRRTTAAGPRD